MFTIFYRYLVQNKSITLPGLGTFQLQNIPAIRNFSDQAITAPMQKATLNTTGDEAQKSLFEYVARLTNVEEWEAVKFVNDFSYDIKKKLKEGEDVYWDKVGVIKAGADGKISLDAKTITYHFMEPVAARRIIRNGATHAILRGDTEFTETIPSLPKSELVPAATIQADVTEYDTEVAEQQPPLQDEDWVNQPYTSTSRWWMWAAILSAIAITIILFHFYQNGFTLEAIFNTSNVDAKDAAPTYIKP